MRQIRIRRKARRPYRCMWALLVPVMLVALLATPASAAAPSNDERSGATVIQDLPFTDRIDATDATNSADDPIDERDDYQYPICWSGPTVWYSYTANRDVRLVANTFNSDYDTVLAVFNGEPSEDSLLVCNDDTRGNQSRAAFEAKSGRTYTFVVSGNSPGLLEFNLRAAIPPRNDNFPDAKRVSVELPFRHSVDTSDATLNVNDPSCSGRARNVWYRYTRPQQWDTRRIAISTRGSDYATSLSVYTGTRQNLKQLECDASGVNSRVRLPAEPGETYWIMVAAANNSQGGDLVLRVKNMPRPFKMDFSVADSGTISSVTGATHVGGTLNCSKKTQASVSVSLRQTQPVGKIKSASESKSLPCGDKRKWAVSLVSDKRPFTAGPAGLWVELNVPGKDRQRTVKKLIELRSCSSCL